MNVSELTDIYDGNLEEWFKSLIDETGLDFDEQQMTYERFKKDTSSVTKSKGQDNEKNMKAEKEINERNASNIKTSVKIFLLRDQNLPLFISFEQKEIKELKFF